MRNICILSLLVALLFVGACSEAPFTAPPIPEDPIELQVSLGLSNVEGYVPFDATTIPMVSGGSGDYDLELFRDDQSLGNDPVQIIRFNEVGAYEFKLKVTDRETGEVKESDLVSVNGLELPPGAPLENWLTSPNPIVRVGEDVFMHGGARGGSGHYNQRILLAGNPVGLVPIMPVTIYELGDNELVLETTDIETGEVIRTPSFMVVGLDPEPTPELQGAMVLAPKRVAVGDPVFITTVGMSGTPPYAGRIEIDGQLISGGFMAVFTPQEERGYHVKCYLNDSAGASLVMEDMIDAYEPEEETHPVTVDISGQHEEQAGNPFYLHADVDGIEYVYGSEDPAILWYMDGESEPFNGGSDIVVTFDNPGWEYINVQVYYQDELVASQAKRLTVTPADASEDARADVWASPNEFQLGESTSLHVDVHNVIEAYFLLEWYEVATGNFLGHGRQVTYTPTTQAQHQVECRVIVNGLMRVNGFFWVTVTPPDPMTVTASAAVVHGLVPRWTSVDADAHGVGLINYVWRKGDAIIGYGESIDYNMVTVGPDTLVVFATDEIGQYDSAMVILTGEVNGGEEVVTWEFCPGLQVGPNDDFATTTTSIEVDGAYQSFIEFEWDALPSGQADACLVEIVLPDGHRHTFRLDKPSQWGQMVIYYELGELRLEGAMTFNFYWLGSNKSGEKCDGWNKWHLYSGNTTVPTSKSDDAVVVRLDDPNRDDYIQRQ
jgi:hypothetical protein